MRRQTQGPSRRANAADAAAILREKMLLELQPGDYVVHVEHGIAKYGGLLRMAREGVEREYMLLLYAENDRLYVPADQTDRVAPYIGAGPPPHLHRLGTQEWARTKRRVKEGAELLAKRTAGALCFSRGRARPRLSARYPLADRAGRQLPLYRDARPVALHRRGQDRHGAAPPDGPPDLRRCGLRQDRGSPARSLQGRHGRAAGGGAGADDGAGPAALHNLLRDGWRPSRSRLRCCRASAPRRSRKRSCERYGRGQAGHRHRHAYAAVQECAVQEPGAGGDRRRAALRRAPQRAAQAVARRRWT